MICSKVDETGKVYGQSRVIVPWWSFTKTVIATLVMRLCDSGKLGLDDNCPGKPFTYRQLLQHTSGLGDYSFLPEYHQAVANNEKPWSVDTLFEKVDVETLRYEPGGGWCYSNIGYLLLRQQLERLYDLEFATLIHDLLVKELGLNSAHLVKDKQAFMLLEGSVNDYEPSWCYHGLIAGTVKDAALFLHYLLNGDIVGTQALAQMQSVLPLNVDVGERPWTHPAIGLGLMCNNNNSLHTVGHTGMGPGSVIAVHHFKQQSPKTIAVFAQGQDQAEVENKAVKLAINGL
ncbi:serine hydrolase domain-containing protein [Pseudoalteromonas luteoviolacea]|uniref:serine hydrolase domain-containing protein n=1 Tax=Pseudoalteromonas luteoviolacea TaxID=43657 RepID=UPI0006918C36|nr:serine hydrolase domain-containing protein [Pseudoalteromonas luteoviolacea]